MKIRSIRAMAAALGIIAMCASAAMALPQTNGSGLTHEGASLGFNAKADLRGEITYTAHDGTGFQVFCRDGLTSYREFPPTAAGYLRTKVTATCTDKDGVTIFAEIYFIDRGEPGDRDVERIFFTYDAAYARDANGDPDAWLTTCNSGVPITDACNDKGIISAGNVQIHSGASSARTWTVVVGSDA